MLDWLSSLCDAADFVPRSQCGAWTSFMVRASRAANAAIAVAYFAVPVALYVLWRRRREDLAHPDLVLGFVAFIGLCGLTHLCDVLAFHWPAYRLFLVLDVATGLISLSVALALPRAVHWLLRQPTKAERDRLAREKAAAEARVKAYVRDLERRIRQLEARKRLTPDPDADDGFAVGGGWASLDDQITQLRSLLRRDTERANGPPP